MQCSPGLLLASVGADLRLRMGECPSVLQIIFNADPKGAYSKQCSTSTRMGAAQPFQSLVGVWWLTCARLHGCNASGYSSGVATLMQSNYELGMSVD